MKPAIPLCYMFSFYLFIYLFIYLHDAFFVFVVQCLIVGFLTF